MKNQVIIILLGIVLFTSCKRDYTCNCTSSWTNQAYDVTIKAKNKQAAQKECESYNKPEVDGPRNCHLK